MSPRFSLQEIFVACLDRFFRNYRKPLHVHKAAAAIRHCRTQVLGGHVMACPEGHIEKAFYNSCVIGRNWLWGAEWQVPF